MNKFWMGLAAASIFAFGCGDKDGDTGDTSAEADADTDTDTDADPDFTVTYTAGGVSLASTNCDDCDGFGIAETNASCEAAEYGCWTAEDCIYGYDSPVSDNSWGPVCHDASAGAVSLTLTDDPNEVSDSAGLTLFNDDFTGLVTYFVETSAGDCYIGGRDESYYTGLGCVSASFTEN